MLLELALVVPETGLGFGGDGLPAKSDGPRDPKTLALHPTPLAFGILDPGRGFFLLFSACRGARGRRNLCIHLQG